MTLTVAKHYNSSLFSIDRTDKVFRALASDIENNTGAIFSNIIDCEYDVPGFYMISCVTGLIAEWRVKVTSFDVNKKVKHWTLIPTAQTVREIPKLSGWTVVIYNG